MPFPHQADAPKVSKASRMGWAVYETATRKIRCIPPEPRLDKNVFSEPTKRVARRA